MEDCICASPSAFLGQEVEIVARQKRIRSFVPDLIVKNRNNEILIIEIQQRALDRYHLYKSLEYRDLILTNSGGAVRIVLFCETMDARFRELLKTHSIELITMERNKFISMAVCHTPEIITSHLTAEPAEESAEASEEEIRLEFKPLDWSARASPSHVLAHLYKEFGRLNLGVENIPRTYYQQIYWDVCNLLDEDFRNAIEKLWLPSAWNYDRLLEHKSGGNSIRQQTSLKRPRISISPFITQKGNLSVVWWPTNFDRGDDDCDWIWWPGDHTAGWSRPNNELFFIREVSHLNPGLHFSEWDDRVNYDVLDGIFIGLVKVSLDHFLNVCRVFFDVELVSDIELDLSGPEAVPGNMFPDRYITGWRFYSLEERKRRNEDEWIANFEKNYGFTVDKFSQFYRIASFQPGVKLVVNVVRKITQDLKKSGHKITEGVVQQIIEKIKKHHSRDIQSLLK
jgi:hypothetical protein